MLNGYAANLQATLLDQESSGDYSAVNSLGYAGGYQFGAAALETLGYLKPGSSKAGNKAAMDDPSNWTGKANVGSLAQFLQDTAAQDNAFQENVDFNLTVLQQKGVVTADTSPADIAGLLAASHLLGAGGASTDLKSVDANGTSGQDYFLLGSNAYNNTNTSTDAVVNFTAQQAPQSPSQPQNAAPSAAPLPQDAVQSFIQVNNSTPAPQQNNNRQQRQDVLSVAYNTSGNAVADPAYNTSDAAGLTAEMINSDEVPDIGGLPSYDLVEAFQRGATSGMESLFADLSYMGAAINVLQGDEGGVADSIANARINEELAAIPMDGIQAFGDFLDEPTVGGFFTQVASGTGQLSASVVSTMAGAGVGSIAMVMGKQALTQSSRAAAKNLIKDALLAVSKKAATPDQTKIAQAAFEATKEAHVLARNGYLRKRTAQKGALAGAGATEYAPLAGSNVSEALDSGRELDRSNAVRAGLVALPQAAIGLFGEVGLVKLLGKQAASKSAGPNSVMGRLSTTLATQFGKGGLIEGSTELVQEELAIRNRMDMDETFTDADANLRRLNAGFVGFFGGGAVAGGGSLALQGASEVINRNVVGDAASVSEKAADMVDSIKEFITRNRAASDIADTAPDQTTTESKRDIDAQLAAMVDTTSSKEAVWISGTKADERIKGTKPNRVRKVTVNEKEAYAAFIPGRGTIISTNFDIVEGVVKGQASDTVLAAALGYSNTKTEGDALVVKVIDKYGDVVSEESTNDAGLAAATAAAQKLMPEGGSITTVSTEEALAERARRNGPEVQMMEDDDADGDGDPLTQDQDSNEGAGDQEFEVDIRTHSFIKDGQQTEAYAAVEGENTFEGVEEAQTAYAEVVGEDIDWSTPFYSRISQSTLKTAVALQKGSPDEVVNIRINKDGSYRIEIETTPNTQKIRIRDGKGTESEVSMGEFLIRSISKAAGSLKKFRSINITAPGSDKPVSVNPVDLMNAGRRIMESTEGSFTGAGAQQSSRQGLLAMLGQLQMAGYEVDIQGVPIADILENLANPTIDLLPSIANITVGFGEAGTKITLGKLLKPYVPGAPSADKSSILNNLKVLPTTTILEIRKLLIASGIPGFRDSGPVGANRAAQVAADTLKDIKNLLSKKDGLRQLHAALTPALRREIGFADLLRREDVVSDEDAREAAQNSDPLEPYDIVAASARTPDGIPLTDMNLEALNNTNTTQNRPIGSAPQTNTNSKDSPRPQVNFRSGATFPFGEINSLASSIVRRISRRLKLKNPVAIISLKGFNEATRGQIASYIISKNTAKGKIALKALKTLDLGDNVAVGKFIQQLQSDGLLAKNIATHVAKVADITLLGHSLVMRAAVDILRKQTTSLRIAEQIAANLVDSFGNPLRKGYHTGYSNGSVIMVNDLHNQNEAAIALVAAHEMGHALFREELNGLLDHKPLYNRMYAAFVRDRQKARDEGKPMPQWEEVGFEEWYADQVASWAKKDMQADQRGAKNAVDSHFKRVVARFKKLWAEMANHPSQTYRRFNTLSYTFAKYMDGVTEARKADRETITVPVYNAEGAVVAYKSALGGITEGNTPETQNPSAAPEAAPNVVAANEGSNDNSAVTPLPEPDEPSFEQKAVVGAIREAIRLQTGASAREEAFRRKMNDWGRKFAEDHPNAIKILGILFTADSMLRIVAGSEVADMFYIQSNTRAGLGFVQSRTLARDRLRADLFKVLGTDWTTPEVQAAFKEAQGKKPTAELKGKAKELREFLEDVHKRYIEPSNTDIGFRKDYFPVLLNLAEIANDPAIFEQLILESDPTADKKKVRAAIQRMLKYQQASLDSDIDMSDIDITDAGANAEASRILTADSNLDFLRDTLFLQEPEVALMSYLDGVTKRVEWNRHTKAPDGTNKLAAALDSLQPGPREVAESVIHAYLGNVTHLSPFWRKSQSYVAALNLVTLLPFAVFASIPDFAGSVVATREFSGFAMFGKQVVSQIRDRESAKRLANDIGVVMPEAAANAWMSQADSDMLDPNVRMATDKFFKYTGLSGLTSLSREFSAGMAKRFLIEHANNPMERSERYLKQLGVTYDQVRRWQDNDFSFEGPEGEAVKAALARFVESSVLRPNAAERPVWASDPRFALIWQLKSFLYAFNKVILEGLEREVGHRFLEGAGLAPAMVPLLLITAAAFMPLAALGLELREYAKVGLSSAVGMDGSRYLRSDKMDWGTYFTELFSRAGLDGPIGMLTMAQRCSDCGGSAVASLLGPTAELAEKILTDGPFDAGYSRVNSPPEAIGAILGVGAFVNPRAALATGLGLASIGALSQ